MYYGVHVHACEIDIHICASVHECIDLEKLHIFPMIALFICSFLGLVSLKFLKGECSLFPKQ